MARLISADRMEKLKQKAQSLVVPLSDKESETLAAIVGSETFVKVIGQLYNHCRECSFQIIALRPLTEPQVLAQAIRLQGYVDGVAAAAELICKLATEEENYEQPESDS